MAVRPGRAGHDLDAAGSGGPTGRAAYLLRRADGLPGLLAIVRNWGFGIAACGGLLVAAAFVPDLRVAAAVFAIVTKAAFIALVLGPGRQAAQRQAKLAVAFDVVVIAALSTWLIARSVTT